MPEESYWESLLDVQLILSRLSIDRFHDVAQLGCGNGTFTIPIAKAIGSTARRRAGQVSTSDHALNRLSSGRARQDWNLRAT